MTETKVKGLNIYAKLSAIQNELKAPKNQFNKFGNFNYRSCEDILEALKPLCHKYNAVLVIHDEVECINERYYIKAVCTLFDCESDNVVTTNAYARESITKKGMDDSQVTGATSSYARKYALNGLFNIDDTKDADTNELKEVQENSKKNNATREVDASPKDKAQLIKENTSLIFEGENHEIDFKDKHKEMLLKVSELQTVDPSELTQEGLCILNKAMRVIIDKKIKQEGAN